MSKPYILEKPVLIAIPKKIIDPSDLVKYLVLHDWQRRFFDEKIFQTLASEKFNQFISEQINLYINEKKAPPAEIATAIMNIADDVLSGRTPIIRTGDYLQLQNYMKQPTPTK